MAYDAHTWVDGETITASKLNNIENGIVNSGYDIVISTTSLDSTNISDYTVEKFNYTDISAKILGGQLVTGVLVYHYNYSEDVDGDTDIDLFFLNHITNYNDGDIICQYNRIGTNGNNHIYAHRGTIVIGSNSVVNDVGNVVSWGITIS